MTTKSQNPISKIKNWGQRVVPILMQIVAQVAVAQPEAPPPQWLQDAELTAVTFIDSDRGWAAGDRGVIWHTGDGGRTWKLQNSGVTCRLEAIQFLDADNGVAVGGWTQPYTHQTHGVALRTRDGGKSWQNTPDLTLPALKHVRFFDTRQGWALGDGSPLYPDGVFRSNDGGRTWSPVPKGETQGWVTGDFRDSNRGLLAGHGGAIATVTAIEVRPERAINLGLRNPTRLLLCQDKTGWLVGDGGLVLTTGDNGAAWSPPKGQLPEFASREIDFRALAVFGSHVWASGAPGTCVVHSPDGGITWQAHRTEQTSPLGGLWFIDEYRGWAVGLLGTILHTRDGGQTWRVQRAGGTRAALLGIFSEPSRIPLDLIADQAGDQAYLTALEVIGKYEGQTDAARRNDLTIPRRTHSAVIAAGGTAANTAWQFPLRDLGLSPTSESIVAKWNAANDGQALARLEEHLVRRIRQWRPDVIVTEDVSPRGENPLAHLTNQVALSAVNKAADPSIYPSQIVPLGLPAWRVKKVFTLLPANKQGIVNLAPSQWASRLGRSPAEQAESARGLLERDVSLSPRNVGLALLVDRLPQDSGKRDVMSGLALQAGGDARRELSDPPPGNLEALAELARKRHNVEQLLDRMSFDATVGSGWLGQANDLTKRLPGRAAGEVLWQLGRQYQHVGKMSDSAEAFQLLMEKYPQHPLADAAAMWLVQYYASGEVAWREKRETKFETRLATAISSEDESQLRAKTGDKQPELQIKPASFASIGTSSTAAPNLHPAERAGRAISLAKQIEQTRPTLYADAALRFAVAAAARQAGQPRTADRFFQSLTANASQSIWSQNAAAEQWLLRPNENPPKKVCSVVTASAKPRLDGRLDDALWKIAKPISLKASAGEGDAYPAAAVLAFDEEFLYLAVSCRRAAGVEYATNAATRAPDIDLSGYDRVTIMLDIDRDYASFWRLTVDHRGWPAESCFGDKTWNPQWFVAAGGDEQFWTVEAAIPLAELTPKKPEVRDVWAIGLERVIPSIGFQSFTTPAAIETLPEGFGLMVFE